MPNYTISKAMDGKTIISWSTGVSDPQALSFKIFATVDEYRYYLESNMLNALLFDGAFLQITYIYENDDLVWHRLCYYPCPFDLDFELLESEPCLDVVDLYTGNVGNCRLRTPIRFDYDPKRVAAGHPASHAHLIASDCRCPVVAPLDIYDFVCFVLSNFYHARWEEIKSTWAIMDRDLLAHTISRDDKKMLHFSVS